MMLGSYAVPQRGGGGGSGAGQPAGPSLQSDARQDVMRNSQHYLMDTTHGRLPQGFYQRTPQQASEMRAIWQRGELVNPLNKPLRLHIGGDWSYYRGGM